MIEYLRNEEKMTKWQLNNTTKKAHELERAEDESDLLHR